MYLPLRGLAAIACAAALHAQAGTPATPAPGLETEWDIGVILREMSAHAGRLLEALNHADAKAWAEKGASETYAEQLESTKAQAKAFQDEALALAPDPEKLADALQLLFRIEGVNAMLGSVEQAMDKYQTPKDAQDLAALAAQNGVNLGRLQKYIVDLAAAREKRFEVMDQEAQRCRAIVIQQPSAAPSATTTGRKK